MLDSRGCDKPAGWYVKEHVCCRAAPWSSSRRECTKTQILQTGWRNCLLLCEATIICFVMDIRHFEMEGRSWRIYKVENVKYKYKGMEKLLKKAEESKRIAEWLTARILASFFIFWMDGSSFNWRPVLKVTNRLSSDHKKRILTSQKKERRKERGTESIEGYKERWKKSYTTKNTCHIYNQQPNMLDKNMILVNTSKTLWLLSIKVTLFTPYLYVMLYAAYETILLLWAYLLIAIRA